MSTSTLVILGAGGHGKVVADAALASGRWSRVVATDRNPARWQGDLLPQVPLLSLQQALGLPGAVFHIAIGAADDREREASLLLGGREFATVVHPAATVSPWVQVERGCFLAAQCVVAPGASLASNVIVNHGAVIDHDVQVQEFSHVAPRAALGGGVRVGRRVLVGAGASVLPGLRICDAAVIGAGAVVIAAILEPGVYAGVPARRVR